METIPPQIPPTLGVAMMRLDESEDCRVIDWPLALSTASQAIKLANDLRTIDKEVSQAELKLKVADLTGALADLKMTLKQKATRQRKTQR
jgi:hypothetical protein